MKPRHVWRQFESEGAVLRWLPESPDPKQARLSVSVTGDSWLQKFHQASLACAPSKEEARVGTALPWPLPLLIN